MSQVESISTTPEDAQRLEDFEKFYEVVDGQPVENPPLGAFATLVANILNSALWAHLQTSGQGRVSTEMLYRLSSEPKLQRRPDVSFVSYERWPRERKPPEDAAWEVVPDLAVEVVSPSNTATEIKGKVREYFQFGVRAVWVIYPKFRTVEVYRSTRNVVILEAGDTLEGEPVLPGFRLPVAALTEDD